MNASGLVPALLEPRQAYTKHNTHTCVPTHMDRRGGCQLLRWVTQRAWLNAGASFSLAETQQPSKAEWLLWATVIHESTLCE